MDMFTKILRIVGVIVKCLERILHYDHHGCSVDTNVHNNDQVNGHNERRNDYDQKPS